jgi:hypothetical protein
MQTKPLCVARNFFRASLVNALFMLNFGKHVDTFYHAPVSGTPGA